MPSRPLLFWDYLRAFKSDYLSIMSGAASVPFSALAVMFSGYARLLFILLAIGCLIYSPFRIWRADQIHIKKLQESPYTDAQRVFVEGRLHTIGTDERDTLRYLVQFGETEQELIERASRIHPVEFGDIFTRANQTQLLRRQERERVGRAGTIFFYRVNPEFLEVLKDELFPREKYEGVSAQRCFLTD